MDVRSLLEYRGGVNKSLIVSTGGAQGLPANGSSCSGRGTTMIVVDGAPIVV